MLVRQRERSESLHTSHYLTDSLTRTLSTSLRLLAKDEDWFRAPGYLT
jgi:hypothetical protein